jgi:hypothetical protein
MEHPDIPHPRPHFYHADEDDRVLAIATSTTPQPIDKNERTNIA